MNNASADAVRSAPVRGGSNLPVPSDPGSPRSPLPAGLLRPGTGALRNNLCSGFARITSAGALLFLFFAGVSCGPKGSATANNPALSTNGTIEVTATLLEIPEGAIFKRDLYEYATVLHYRILKVHRGEVKTDTIYVGHYNPWKPRSEAADARVKTVGGNLRRFQAGQVHHLALELPIEDHFMGGIVNKYFGKTTDPIYWAVWTDLERE